MSVRLLAKAFEAPDSLRGSNRLVLLALADHASEEGWCWPGVNRISKKAAIGRRQVQKCLAQLVETGFLEKHYRPGKTTMYRLTLVPDEGGELWDTGEPGDTPGVNCGTPKPLVNRQSPSSLGKEDGAGFDFWEGDCSMRRGLMAGLACLARLSGMCSIEKPTLGGWVVLLVCIGLSSCFVLFTIWAGLP